jgi:hypothetical protein
LYKWDELKDSGKTAPGKITAPPPFVEVVEKFEKSFLNF